MPPQTARAILGSVSATARWTSDATLCSSSGGEAGSDAEVTAAKPQARKMTAREVLLQLRGTVAEVTGPSAVVGDAVAARVGDGTGVCTGDGKSALADQQVDEAIGSRGAWSAGGCPFLQSRGGLFSLAEWDGPQESHLAMPAASCPFGKFSNSGATKLNGMATVVSAAATSKSNQTTASGQFTSKETSDVHQAQPTPTTEHSFKSKIELCPKSAVANIAGCPKLSEASASVSESSISSKSTSESPLDTTVEKTLADWFQNNDSSLVLSRVVALHFEQHGTFARQLVAGALDRGGAAAAWTARLLSKLVVGGCLTLGDIRIAFLQAVEDILLQQQSPLCIQQRIKCLAILYGAMVVIDDREFSFQWLHELIAPLVGILVAGKIVGDDEEHSVTALARVLNTVQLLVGSDQASAIYRRQSGLFPVKKFWVRSVSVSEVLDWMELHGLETLIEATGAHDASPVKLTPVSAIESSESTVTLCDEQPEERTAELPTIVITAADDSGSLQAIAEPVVDEQTTATTTREMDAALDGWFDAFDSVALVVALGRIGGAGGAVDEEKLVQRLLFGSIVRGGGAVARTAKVMVEILKSRECGLSFGGVMSSFKVFVDKIDETAQNYPATFKYFGIVYGMLLVEFEYEFSLAALAKLLRNTIVEDEASMSALKILRQVLGVAQSILGDGGLLALYVRQGVTLETFWAPRDRSLENVKDFLEASSLEFLVGITFSH